MRGCARGSRNDWARFELGTGAKARPHFWVWLWVLLGLTGGESLAQSLTNEAAQVAVLFNTREKASRDVAEFYAHARGIPADRIIGLDCPSASTISREEYERQIVGPLRDHLEGRGLVRFATEVVDPAPNRSGGIRHRLAASKIRYLVTVYGMPYRIGNDTNRTDTYGPDTPAHVRKNGAALDNELILLPSEGSYPIAGAANNPYHNATNPGALGPANGIFLVSRLDGPTPELAKGLVTQALQAERDGLWGRAYFDLRGLKDGNYKTGDDWIASAAAVARFIGFETYVDQSASTLPVGFPLSEVAFYAGWYDQDASGPFTSPVVEFVPGAIAYHIHSYSAGNPRSGQKHWVGPLIARGATVTMGCVDEPFLPATPNIGVFLARLVQGFNVGESYLAATPTLSWQNILIGDPLYRPFLPNLFDRAREMLRTNSPFLPWAIAQTVNYQIQQGTNVDLAIRALEEMPASTNNAVLAEKLARLYESKSRLNPAIQFARTALAAGGTPQQRVRLLLDMAEWQRTLDRPKEAFETLERFTREFPEHPRILSVLREQLDYARDLDRREDEVRIKAEIERLTPPANPADGKRSAKRR